MKELRPGSAGRSELRILFAFDPERHAILLVAGDKSGNWTRWYKKNIPMADDLGHLPHSLRGTRRPPAHAERNVIEMAMSLKDFVTEHAVDPDRVEAHKRQMLTEVRAYRLRELREQAGLTQAQLAERIGVGQRQVSKIENSDLDTTKIGTIRSYLEAVGGGLAIEYVMGDERFQVA